MFPYKYRKYQKEIIHQVREGLNQKRHIVLESGTGSGKTICVMYAIYEYLKSNNDNRTKVIYTTRTNSQQKQVLYELRKIGDIDFFGCGLQGRANLCRYVSIQKELRYGTSEELSIFCRNQKKKGCIYFDNISELVNLHEFLDFVKRNIPTVEEIKGYAERREICAYELIKMILSEAKVVVVPYIYFFYLPLRERLIELMHCELNEIILVVDEAHNLPDYIRDLNSMELSIPTLKIASEEGIHMLGNPHLTENIKLTDFCRTVRDIIIQTKKEYISGNENIDETEDALIPSDLLETEIMSNYSISDNKLRDIIQSLIKYGEIIKTNKLRHGKLPRSYIYKLGIFLHTWMDCNESNFAKIVTSTPKLEIYCLDPSINTKIINDCFCSIHISGTLEPLNEYIDSIGIDNPLLGRYPSPFPEKNRLVIYVSDVTTKYEVISNNDEMIYRLKDYVTRIITNFPRNTIVFFPSFSLMEKFTNILHGRKNVFVERKEISQQELMKIISDFKVNRHSVLFSVFGGRISEGIDFPAESLEIVVLVGLPYPKPTAKQTALKNYYDIKFGKGWEYVVKTPAVRKVKQAVGRLIRKETDRGIAIILDRRASHFKKYMKLYEINQFDDTLHRFFTRICH